MVVTDEHVGCYWVCWLLSGNLLGMVTISKNISVFGDCWNDTGYGDYQ